MLIFISPAKSLDLSAHPATLSPTQPSFLPQTAELVAEMRSWSVEQLQQQMKLSPNLAQLNWQRFQDFQLPQSSPDTQPEEGFYPAVFAFNGDVYQGLQARDWSAQQLAGAQQSLRILSGLYGLLRPLDLIQPYRLEMGTAVKLAQHGTQNLYQFWQPRLQSHLEQELAQQPDSLVVNLASQEYAKAVPWSKLELQYLEPQFYEIKAGKRKIISFYAKKARGLMARYLLDKPSSEQAVLDFAEQGYAYDPENSTELKPCFVRTHD